MEKEQMIALVLQAQKGAPEAFSALFQEYKDMVYGIALRETKDPALADDITQETFLEVLQQIGDVREPAAFPKWLKTVVYHQCSRHYKKKETRREVMAADQEDGLSVFDTLEEQNAAFLPDEALDQKEFRETILGMLEDLPDVQRSALYMFYYEQMPLKTIAQVQGVSVNTANTRLNRGRLAVKASIERYEKKHGVRLHSIALVPLFRWLLGATQPAMPAASAVQAAEALSHAAQTAGAAGKAAAAGAGANATTAGAGAKATAAAAGAKAAGAAAATKIAAGAAAVALAVSIPLAAQQMISATPSAEEGAVSQTSVQEADAYGADGLEDAEGQAQETEGRPAYDVAYEELLRSGVTASGLQINYYALLDLDENGTPELIAADQMGTSDVMTQCEIYTYGENQLVFVGEIGAYLAPLYYANGYLIGSNVNGAEYLSLEDSIAPSIEGAAQPVELLENEFRQEATLEQIIDLSRSWSIQCLAATSLEDWPIHNVLDFGLSEDGSMACYAYTTYTDFFYGFYGTYQIEGNVITFTCDGEDGAPVSYVYSYDPHTRLVTQVSEKGFWGKAPGMVYTNFADRIHAPTAQDVWDSAAWAIEANKHEMAE